jgi:hypothetical protein
VNLANGARRGDPFRVARRIGWEGYGVANVVAWTTNQTMGELIEENVPFDYVKTGCSGGTR